MPEYNNNYNGATNNQFQNRVTTSGLTLFDENGVMLRLAYLDDSFSLLIGEPKLSENGKRSYPQEMRHPFIITMDRATTLYEKIILKKVLSSFEKGENYNGGVFLNKRKDAIFEIRVQDGDIYLVYHNEIGEDRKPKNSYVFKCQKTSTIENYNPDGSDFSQSQEEGTFMVICKYFESGIFDIANSSAHAYRKGNHYTTTAIFNYLKGIAAKLGVTVERSTNFTSRSNDSNSGFMNIPNNSGDELPFQDDSVPAATSLTDLIA